MPRKETGEKLEKVVSSKLPLADFVLLESYEKNVYQKYDHSAYNLTCFKIYCKRLGIQHKE
jgi:hypothetical protein